MKKNRAVKGTDKKFEKKTVGIVEIITGDKVAKLTLQGNKEFKSTGNSVLKVKLSDLPSRPKIPANMKTPLALRVRMNEDDTAPEEFGPVDGEFSMKAVRFGYRAEEDDDPMPKEKEGKYGEYKDFFVVYKFLSGAFKGNESAYYLPYSFQESEEVEGTTSFNFNPEYVKSGSRNDRFLKWGDVHNLWEKDIFWDDETILPELEDRVLEGDLTVLATFENGYINKIRLDTPNLDDLLDTEDVDDAFPPDEESDKEEVEEKPAPKKVRKPRKVEDEDDDL